ncbi:MAG: redoxin domain-containing protein [Deltaproteobacteria bacterium]
MFTILMIGLLFCLNFFGLSAPVKSAESNTWEPREGSELIGTRAPSLSGLEWLNTKPLKDEDLRGKVVLVRFWLIACPYCERTAPSLVELYKRYRDRGFLVIGIHHPKSARSMNTDTVIKAAKVFGFDFPIAHDSDWKVINDYWLGDKRRSFTSSSFLIDRKGVIRFVHDGGEFYRNDDNSDANLAFLTIEKKIRDLLGEE